MPYFMDVIDCANILEEYISLLLIYLIPYISMQIEKILTTICYKQQIRVTFMSHLFKIGSNLRKAISTAQTETADFGL